MQDTKGTKDFFIKYLCVLCVLTLWVYFAYGGSIIFMA